jgi:hypothetical protein
LSTTSAPTPGMDEPPIVAPARMHVAPVVINGVTG